MADVPRNIKLAQESSSVTGLWEDTHACFTKMLEGCRWIPRKFGARKKIEKCMKVVAYWIDFASEL